MEEKRVATRAAAKVPKAAPRQIAAGRTAARAKKGSKSTAPASSKSRRSAKKSGHYKSSGSWWAAPVSASLIVVIVVICSYIAIEAGNYIDFMGKLNAVERSTFYDGVSIDGVDVSDMTIDQALSEWNTRDQRVRDSLHMKLVLGDKSWPIDEKSLGYDSDYKSVVMGAWSVGRFGTLDERYQAVQKLGTDEWKRDFSVNRELDQAVALSKLEQFCQSLSIDAVESKVAGYDLNDNTFMFTKSSSGKKVYADELLQDIKSAAASGGKTVQIVQQIGRAHV